MSKFVGQTLDGGLLKGATIILENNQLEGVFSYPFEVNSQPVAPVPIDALVLAGSPRRDGENWEHVRMLAELDDALPPIMVHKPTMRVIDGVHRVQAAMLNGRDTIAARLLDCDADAAHVLAVRANIAHGLPLSQPDRMAAAARIIAAHPLWSNRAVAAVTGLSDKTVSRIREQSGGEEAGEARLGRDGRRRPLDSGVRRRRAAAMISDNPRLGLRTVARATGLSPATVQDVRQRMARGEDPVPDRYRTTGNGAAKPSPADPPQTSAANRALGTDGSVDQYALLAKLRNDPSLRFNESGRHVLRWLHRYTVDAEGMERLCSDMPDHCAPIIADLARSWATVWNSMAERLRNRVD